MSDERTDKPALDPTAAFDQMSASLRGVPDLLGSFHAGCKTNGISDEAADKLTSQLLDFVLSLMKPDPMATIGKMLGGGR